MCARALRRTRCIEGRFPTCQIKMLAARVARKFCFLPECSTTDPQHAHPHLITITALNGQLHLAHSKEGADFLRGCGEHGAGTRKQHCNLGGTCGVGRQVRLARLPAAGIGQEYKPPRNETYNVFSASLAASMQSAPLSSSATSGPAHHRTMRRTRARQTNLPQQPPSMRQAAPQWRLEAVALDRRP